MPRCSSRHNGVKTAPVVQWLRDLRRRNKAQFAGVDDIDEDMGTDNTKRPRRRLQLRLRYHGQSRLRAGPRNTAGSCMWGGVSAPHWVFSLRCSARLPLGAEHSQMPLRQKIEFQSSVSNRFAAAVTLPPGRLMCVDISCSCLLQSGWPVVFLRGCGLVGWWCGHQHGDAHHSCGEVVPTCWRSLRGSIVGFRVWLLLVDTSAA